MSAATPPRYAVTKLSPIKLAYSPDEACEALSCCRSTLYKIIREGHLDVRRMGTKKTIITAESLQAYMSSLPTAEVTDPFIRRALEKEDA
jgi:excisionase family DNA binding protein